MKSWLRKKWKPTTAPKWRRRYSDLLTVFCSHDNQHFIMTPDMNIISSVLSTNIMDKANEYPIAKFECFVNIAKDINDAKSIYLQEKPLNNASLSTKITKYDFVVTYAERCMDLIDLPNEKIDSVFMHWDIKFILFGQVKCQVKIKEDFEPGNTGTFLAHYLNNLYAGK